MGSREGRQDHGSRTYVKDKARHRRTPPTARHTIQTRHKNKAATTTVDTAQSDEGLDSQVDTRGAVEVGTVQVLLYGTALDDRDERQFRGQSAQGRIVRDGPALVFDDRQAGASEPHGPESTASDDDRFTHPVLGRRPYESADLVAVATPAGDVLGGMTVHRPKVWSSVNPPESSAHGAAATGSRL